jgi:hypothetical protein
MAGDALFLGWGPVVRGREMKALAVFQETIAYYGRLQQEGKIDGFEPMLLGPHGGELAGFIVLRGDRAALDQIRAGEEFRRMTARADAVVDDLGVVECFGGEALAQQMAIFQAVSEELGGSS